MTINKTMRLIKNCTTFAGINLSPLPKSLLVASGFLIFAGCSGESDENSSSSQTTSSVVASSSSSAPNFDPNGIVINEAAGANIEFFDEDGDTPDWIELYNGSDQAISLNSWSITDKEDEPLQWVFPDITLGAGEYLHIWASDEDRKTQFTHRTLVAAGDSFFYTIPDDTTPANWMSADADLAGWQQGESGFGYGDADDATLIPEEASALFVRRTFSINDPSTITQLMLHMDYDDGFIVYLNGNEIARANMDSNEFDALANAEHEATFYQSGEYELFSVDDAQQWLNAGENILAVQVHNASENSSDLSLTPILSAQYSSPSSDGYPPEDVLGLEDTLLHTNFKLSSSGETVYLFDDQGVLIHSLEIIDAADRISVGLSVNTGETVLFQQPTPGTANTSEEFIGVVRSQVTLSQQGGINSPAMLTLSGNGADEVIRYTLDGTIPTASSTIYEAPFSFSETQSLRARIFKDQFIPGNTVSRTFLPTSTHDLPVVTLITDPLNFFDFETGIYELGPEHEARNPYYGANFWQDWERDIHFAFYETDGTLAVAQDAGVKIFGGWSRAHAQKSLAIFARDKYGKDEIEYPFFSQRPYSEFKSLVLRNSGNDWMSTKLRDAAMTSLMEGSGLDIQAHQPVAVYLNNEYWGLYNLREKVNEDFLAQRHNVDKDDIDLLEGNANILEGTNTDYLQLIEFIENNSLSDASAYQWVSERMDIENFMIYSIAQIYFNNTDWPGNNIKYWRAPQTKWRWILYDTDFGFGLYEDEDEFDYNALEHALADDSNEEANPPWSTFLLRRLLENSEFKQRFIQRFNDELNNRFNSAAVIEHIDRLAANIVNEMPNQLERWAPNSGPRSNTPDWQGEIDKMKEFARVRPDAVRSHLMNQFALGDVFTLTLSNVLSDQGVVTINQTLVEEENWSGAFFSDWPVVLNAQASAGYEFTHWQDADGEVLSTNAQWTVDLTSDLKVSPVFSLVEQ